RQRRSLRDFSAAAEQLLDRGIFAMSIVAKYTGALTIVETPSVNVDALAARQSLTLNGFDRIKNYDGVSGPQATIGAAFKKALSSGSATIDLTAIPQTGGGTADGTSKNVLAARF